MKKILYISVIGIFSALSIVLVLSIHFPLIPAVPFLEYDPADIPIYLITAFLGPVAGLIMTAIVSIIQGVTVSVSSGIIGIIMHFLATGFFVITEGYMLKLLNKKSSALTSLSIAILTGFFASVAVMVLWNLLFTPIYMNIPFAQLLPLLPFIILFNVIKAGLNGIATFVLYCALHAPVSYILKKSGFFR